MMSVPRPLVVLGSLVLSGCGAEGSRVVDTSLCQFQQGPCQVQDASLYMRPVTAPSEQPIALDLELSEGTKIVSANIEGRDMYMGHIPVSFDEAGQAEVIYGSCSSDHMVWRLTLVLKNKDGTQVSRHFDWLADNDQS